MNPKPWKKPFRGHIKKIYEPEMMEKRRPRSHKKIYEPETTEKAVSRSQKKVYEPETMEKSK
jgi:hypothetical protein